VASHDRPDELRTKVYGERVVYDNPWVRLTLVDIEPQRAALASTLGVGFTLPEAAPENCDLVIHASASAAGLATALVSPDQLLRAIGLRATSSSPAAGDALLEALRDGPLGIDELAARLRLSGAALSGRIAAHLVRGRLATLPDGRLRRVT